MTVPNLTPHPRDSGFTLLEMLVVLALLGLMITVLTGAISFGIAARGRINAVEADREDLTSLRLVMVQKLAEAYPDWVRFGDHQAVDFEGDADHLTFLAPALQTLGPGLAHYHFEAIATGRARVLRLRTAFANAVPNPKELSADFA